MAKLYHFVPPNMRGNVLYPLNAMKEVYPDIYREAYGKYEGREHVTAQRIPGWDCLWNDVLFLTVLDPAIIKRTLAELGAPHLREFDYYEIDPHQLDPEKAMVYLYPPRPPEDREMHPEDFIPYNPESLERYATLPEATREYFKFRLKNDKKLLWFVFVPHILYRGTIDISRAAIRRG